MEIIPIITDAGLQASAQANGIILEVTHIAVGTSGYAPNANQTGLVNERMRVAVADAKKIGDNQFHVSALLEGADAFWVKEVGFFLADGTLLGVWSHPVDALLYKSANVTSLIGQEVAFASLPADSITINSTGANLNIFFAGELAQLSTAQINAMTRQLHLQQRIEDMANDDTVAQTLNLHRAQIAYATQKGFDNADALTRVERRVTHTFTIGGDVNHLYPVWWTMSPADFGISNILVHRGYTENAGDPVGQIVGLANGIHVGSLMLELEGCANIWSGDANFMNIKRFHERYNPLFASHVAFAMHCDAASSSTANASNASGLYLRGGGLTYHITTNASLNIQWDDGSNGVANVTNIYTGQGYTWNVKPIPIAQINQPATLLVPGYVAV